MKGISCCNQKKQVLHYQNRRSDNHSPDNGVVNQETPPDISIQIPSSYSPTLRKVKTMKKNIRERLNIRLSL